MYTRAWFSITFEPIEWVYIHVHQNFKKLDAYFARGGNRLQRLAHTISIGSAMPSKLRGNFLEGLWSSSVSRWLVSREYERWQLCESSWLPLRTVVYLKREKGSYQKCSIKIGIFKYLTLEKSFNCCSPPNPSLAKTTSDHFQQENRSENLRQ